MRRIITILSLVLLTASCSKKLSPTVETVIKETITTDTVYVPKEKIITIPGDSVMITDTIPCPELNYHKEATSKSGNVKATVNISKGNLQVDCKTDSLIQRIQWLEAHSKQVVNKETTITITPPPKRYIPKWVWWLLVINIIYVAARIAIKIYKVPIRI